MEGLRAVAVAVTVVFVAEAGSEAEAMVVALTEGADAAGA